MHRSEWKIDKTEVVSRDGIVCAHHLAAAEAGAAMLERGGNAVDAAVAAAFAVGVAEPAHLPQRSNHWLASARYGARAVQCLWPLGLCSNTDRYRLGVPAVHNLQLRSPNNEYPQPQLRRLTLSRPTR